MYPVYAWPLAPIVTVVLAPAVPAVPVTVTPLVIGSSLELLAEPDSASVCPSFVASLWSNT